MIRVVGRSALTTLAASLAIVACNEDPFSLDDLNLTSLSGRFAAQSVDGAPLPARVFAGTVAGAPVSYHVTRATITFASATAATVVRAIRVDSASSSRSEVDSQVVVYQRRARDLTMTLDAGQPSQYVAAGFVENDSELHLNLIVRTPVPVASFYRHRFLKE